MVASSSDVKDARTFLAGRKVRVSPRRFATAAKQLGKTFAELLALIMRLQMGGQGLGPAPIGERLARKR
jgi:hypothetical protein